MSKKQLYSVILSISVIVIIAAYWKLYQPSEQIKDSMIDNRVEKQSTALNNKSSDQKKTHNSGFKLFASSKHADFFEDIPCKESYMIFNYFSELLDDYDKRSASLKEMAIKLAENNLFDKALQIVNLIDDNEQKKKEFEKKDKQVFYMEGDDERNKVLDKILAKGDMKEFQKTIEGLIHGGMDEKSSTIEGIVKELAKAGEVERALKIANNIDKSNSKFAYAMEHIIDYLVENKEFDRALNIAQSLEESSGTNSDSADNIAKYAKSNAYSKIAQKLMKTGDFEEALRISNSIDHKDIKIETLTEIAKGFMESEQRTKALDLFQSTIDLVDSDKENSSSMSFMEAESLNKIAFELAKAGEMKWSKEIFKRTLKAMRALDKENMWQSPKTVKDIINAGHYEWGIAEAYDYTDKTMTRSIFVDSAMELSKMNKNEYADQLFKKGIELLNIEIEKYPDEGKDRSRRMLSDNLAYSGRFDWALQIVNTIKSKEEKDWAFSVIADNLAENNQVEKAMNVLDFIENDKTRFDTLKGIFVTLIKTKNYDWYYKVLLKMLELTNAQKDEKTRNEWFFSISENLMDLPCSEQQKYIQKFVTAYDSNRQK
jgi:hypothetical protein